MDLDFASSFSQNTALGSVFRSSGIDGDHPGCSDQGSAHVRPCALSAVWCAPRDFRALGHMPGSAKHF